MTASIRISGGKTLVGKTKDCPPYLKERKYRRFDLRYPVHVQVHAGDSASELDAVSRNVSLGGILLEAGTSIPQYCPVTLTMTLQGGHLVRPIQLTAEGRVVRVEQSNPGFAIAVECSRPLSGSGLDSL
jgi:hypothetical protein